MLRRKLVWRIGLPALLAAFGSRIELHGAVLYRRGPFAGQEPFVPLTRLDCPSG